MQATEKVVCRLLPACLLYSAISCGALAQSAPDIEAVRRQADTLQRQQQEQLKRDQDTSTPDEKRPRGADIRTSPAKPSSPTPSQMCRPIGRVEISGATKLSGDARAKIHEEFDDRCLSVTDIEQALALITRDYMVRGFITTRAYLPEQDLSTGHLEIKVLEGRIDRLLLEDGGRDSVFIFSALPLKQGDILNLRDIEQGLDQINQLQSNHATFDIRPAKAPGYSDVIIHNDPSLRLHGSISYDNQGAINTGRDQLGLLLIGDNLLGLGGAMVMTHRESLFVDQTRAFANSSSIQTTFPLGYNTLTFSSSWSNYMSQLPAPSGSSLQTTGDTATRTAGWDRVIYRDQSHRASLAANFSIKESNNYLEGQLLQVSSRRLSVLDVDGSLAFSIGQGWLSTDLGYAAGLSAGGALQDSADLADDAPHAQFGKVTFGASYNTPLLLWDREWRLSSQLTGQYALDGLYGSEQIAIGGLYSVRGFVNSTLSGDHGYYFRTELSLSQPLKIAQISLPLRIYGALDVGSARSRATGTPGGTLVGAALGSTLTWGRTSLDLMGTCPVALPRTLERETCQGWIRLSLAL